jgi:hypothetical protein
VAVAGERGVTATGCRCRCGKWVRAVREPGATGAGTGTVRELQEVRQFCLAPN